MADPKQYQVIRGAMVIGEFNALKDALEFAHGECNRLTQAKTNLHTIYVTCRLGDDTVFPGMDFDR